jgi:hypothetical protein
MPDFVKFELIDLDGALHSSLEVHQDGSLLNELQMPLLEDQAVLTLRGLVALELPTTKTQGTLLMPNSPGDMSADHDYMISSQQIREATKQSPITMDKPSTTAWGSSEKLAKALQGAETAPTNTLLLMDGFTPHSNPVGEFTNRVLINCTAWWVTTEGKGYPIGHRQSFPQHPDRTIEHRLQHQDPANRILADGADFPTLTGELGDLAVRFVQPQGVSQRPSKDWNNIPPQWLETPNTNRAPRI